MALTPPMTEMTPFCERRTSPLAARRRGRKESGSGTLGGKGRVQGRREEGQTGQEEGRGAREGGIDDGGAVKIGLEGRRDGTRRKTETELAVCVVTVDDDVVGLKDAGLDGGREDKSDEEDGDGLHFLPLPLSLLCGRVFCLRATEKKKKKKNAKRRLAGNNREKCDWLRRAPR